MFVGTKAYTSHYKSWYELYANEVPWGVSQSW